MPKLPLNYKIPLEDPKWPNYSQDLKKNTWNLKNNQNTPATLKWPKYPHNHLNGQKIPKTSKQQKIPWNLLNDQSSLETSKTAKIPLETNRMSKKNHVKITKMPSNSL